MNTRTYQLIRTVVEVDGKKQYLDMTVVEGQPYYKSIGENDEIAGVWYPFILARPDDELTTSNFPILRPEIIESIKTDARAKILATPDRELELEIKLKQQNLPEKEIKEKISDLAYQIALQATSPRRIPLNYAACADNAREPLFSRIANGKFPNKIALINSIMLSATSDIRKVRDFVRINLQYLDENDQKKATSEYTFEEPITEESFTGSAIQKEAQTVTPITLKDQGANPNALLYAPYLSERLNNNLATYIAMREQEIELNKGTKQTKHYLSFWGRLFSHFDATVKINAAKKLLAYSKGQNTEAFNDNELKALRDGRLGKYLAMYNNFLPPEFLRQEREMKSRGFFRRRS